mmetsp:Transcript_6699/g.18276  ORF Transcript_6699/g.18276 Transcript_6699/m.18276 type:complete len:274 (-) Transcript_6699:177-998(-)
MQPPRAPAQHGSGAACRGNGPEGNQRGREPAEHLYKTKICDWHLEGHCRRGSRCSFAHGLAELRKRDFHKTQLCAFFAQGSCKCGSRCRYAHGVGELRTTFLPEQPSGAGHRSAQSPIPAGPCRGRLHGGVLVGCPSTEKHGSRIHQGSSFKAAACPGGLPASATALHSDKKVAAETIGELLLGAPVQTWQNPPGLLPEVAPPQSHVGASAGLLSMSMPGEAQGSQGVPSFRAAPKLLASESKAAKRREELWLLTKVLADIVYGDISFQAVSL